jgi:hypothetical protein
MKQPGPVLRPLPLLRVRHFSESLCAIYPRLFVGMSYPFCLDSAADQPFIKSIGMPAGQYR